MTEIAHPPQPDTILTGPFWPGPVRVLRATASDHSVRIEAVGVGNSQYYDRTLTLDQFHAEVSQLLGGTHTFDADPAMFTREFCFPGSRFRIA